jgi:hypothetical protein
VLPTGAVGVLFLFAALSPGFLYHRAVARYRPRDSRSAVVEVVEFATAGALTSIVALVAVLAVGEIIPGLLTLNDVASNPAALRTRAWSVVGSSALVLVISFGLAAAAGRFWAGRSAGQRGQLREGSAWAGVLARKQDGKPAYLSVELDDGRLLEGVFRSVSVAEEPARDALALRRPIRICPAGGSERVDVDEDFVLIPRSAIKAVHGTYRLIKRPEPEKEG